MFQMSQSEQRIGVFVCECGRNIAGSVDCEAVRAYAEGLPRVVYTTVNKYTCAEPGQQEIKRGIVEHNLDRVVVASCTPRNYEPIFRECVAESSRWQLAHMEQLDVELEEKLRQKGMKFTYPDRAAFEAACKPAYEAIFRRLGPQAREIVNRIRETR